MKFTDTNTHWIEINKANLLENLNKIRKVVGKKTKLMGIVKQSAYGHGLIQISKYLEENGIDFLGVNNPQEAIVLLYAKIKKPLLILSNTLPSEEIDILIDNKVRFSLMEQNLLSCLQEKAKQKKTKALVHLKVDTGMNRLGINYQYALPFIEEISSCPNIELEGLYSHLSVADTDYEYTENQIQKFQNLLSKIEEKGFNIPLKHISNSSGTINFTKTHSDMVRTGLLLYGIKPHPDLDIKVKPVLSLKARITYIKKIAKGTFVSYGNTFKADRDITAGIVPFGYAYGYPWKLSNKAKVIIQGTKCPVIGRVCMDHIIVDLTNLKQPVDIGQQVTLIGKDKDVSVSAEELAKQANTIPYEIVSQLSERIPRVYTNVPETKKQKIENRSHQ